MITERVQNIIIDLMGTDDMRRLPAVCDAILYLCDEVERLSQRIDDIEKREIVVTKAYLSAEKAVQP